jgi:hypothetical protein
MNGPSPAVSPPNDDRSIFIREDEAYVATASAGGPWHQGRCHGGAVAGLMALAVGKVPSRAPMGLARLSLDLFGPVPTGAPILPRIAVDKDGVRTQRIRVDLLVADRILASGTALKVRKIGQSTSPERAVPVDEARRVRGSPGGFATAFEIVAERGGIAQPGPGRVWFRLALPLVDQLPFDGVAHAVAAADFSSAIGMNRDIDRFAFPSVDLTVGFARAPIGEWVLVEASNHDCDEGRAICHATLSDTHGAFAQVVQTSFVEPRADKGETR